MAIQDIIQHGGYCVSTQMLEMEEAVKHSSTYVLAVVPSNILVSFSACICPPRAACDWSAPLTLEAVRLTNPETIININTNNLIPMYKRQSLMELYYLTVGAMGTKTLTAMWGK